MLMMIFWAGVLLCGLALVMAIVGTGLVSLVPLIVGAIAMIYASNQNARRI